jgi:hypothetical protein
MNATLTGTVSGIGSGDSVNQLEIVWKSGAESEAAAMAAGRGVILTGANATAFTAGGYSLSSTALVSGQTYTPAIRVTENMSGGGTQTGVWTSGTAFVAAVAEAAWWTNEMAGDVLPVNMTPAWTYATTPSLVVPTGALAALNGDGTFKITYPVRSNVMHATSGDGGTSVITWQTGTLGSNAVGNEYEARFKLNAKSLVKLNFSLFDNTKFEQLQIGQGKADSGIVTIQRWVTSAFVDIATINLDQYYNLRVAIKGAVTLITLDGATIFSGTPGAYTGATVLRMGLEPDVVLNNTLTSPETIATIDYFRWKTNGTVII